MDKFFSKKIIKYVLFPFLIVLFSVICGVLSNDLVLVGLTLVTGFLNAYYMAIGKWYNYIFNFLFTLLYSYVCFINGFYGFGIFSLVVYIPLQIFGFISWYKKEKFETVVARSLNFKNSFVLCSSIILGSLIVGFLLILIPGQNLPFLNSTAQIINVGGFLLVALRFREAWIVWLANNIADLTIWIINTINGSANGTMMLITSIMFLSMNVFGLLFWIKIEKEQNKL